MAPPPLVVRNNPAAYRAQVATILLFAALFAIVPLVLGDPEASAPRGPALVTILLVGWAFVAIRQSRSQEPQIIVDATGLYVRGWHLGVVPWDDIVLVAQGNALRQPLATRVFRSRLGGYLTVRFRRYPPFQSSSLAPLSWFQWLAHQLDNSDPVISAARLDTSLADIMTAIDAQIGYRKQAAG